MSSVDLAGEGRRFGDGQLAESNWLDRLGPA